MVFFPVMDADDALASQWVEYSGGAQACLEDGGWEDVG